MSVFVCKLAAQSVTNAHGENRTVWTLPSPLSIVARKTNAAADPFTLRSVNTQAPWQLEKNRAVWSYADSAQEPNLLIQRVIEPDNTS